jgi:hypothetical protein
VTSIAQQADRLRLEAQREADGRPRHRTLGEWMRLRSIVSRWPRLLGRQGAAATRGENAGPRF